MNGLLILVLAFAVTALCLALLAIADFKDEDE
jgi:hypothetical protein